ncbi:hypothetical protein D3C78_354050 [compost metagenome]
MTAADLATGSRCRAGGRGFGVLGRVDACGNGSLQRLDVGDVLLARRRRRLGDLLVAMLRMGRRLQLAGEGQRAVASEGDFTASRDLHGHRAMGAGDQLLADIKLVARAQRTARSVGRQREDFAFHLADDTQ